MPLLVLAGWAVGALIVWDAALFEQPGAYRRAWRAARRWPLTLTERAHAQLRSVL